MNDLSLRAKYTVEQYLIFFHFPGVIVGIPNIVVDVTGGVDPFPEGFAGLPIINGDTVACVVTGGIAGCIYRVTCEAVIVGAEEFSISATIAVIATPAIPPRGSDGPPPVVQVVTTPPYPYLFKDSLGVSSVALPGTLHTFLLSYEYSEKISVASLALNGSIRSLVLPYAYLESVAVGSSPLDGVLRSLVRSYEYRESVAVTSEALDGVLRVVVLQYLNYIPESVDVSSVSLDGVLAAL